MNLNPECCGSCCESACGETRYLPIPNGGGIFVCRRCYEREIEWRKDRNRMLAEGCRYSLPEWDLLEPGRDGE